MSRKATKTRHFVRTFFSWSFRLISTRILAPLLRTRLCVLLYFINVLCCKNDVCLSGLRWGCGRVGLPAVLSLENFHIASHMTFVVITPLRRTPVFAREMFAMTKCTAITFAATFAG